MRKQVLVLMLFITLVPLTSAVKVGVYNNPPKVYVDEAGEPAGFWVDIMDHIAEQEDWQVEYVECVWNDCMEKLERGEIDVFMDVAVSEEREQVYDFNDQPVLLNWARVYVHPGTGITTLLDLEGKKTAVMKGGIHYIGPSGIKALLEDFQVRTEFIEADDYDQIFRLVEEGTADAGVVNRVFGVTKENEYDVEGTAIFINPVQLKFAFPKGAEGNALLIPAIDRNLVQMKADQKSVYYTALEEHLGEAVSHVEVFPMWAIYTLLLSCIFLIVCSQVYLTTRERASIRKTLVDNSPVPMCMIGKNGKITLVNKALEKMAGYSASELEGQEVFKYLTEDSKNSVTLALLRLFVRSRPPKLEVGLKTKSGVRYVEAEGELISTWLQKQALIIMLDVTERKKLWKKLKGAKK